MAPSVKTTGSAEITFCPDLWHLGRDSSTAAIILDRAAGPEPHEFDWVASPIVTIFLPSFVKSAASPAWMNLAAGTFATESRSNSRDAGSRAGT
jgi:hypothetical protein